MFTILCCNLKDFISKSPKPWRLLETTFLLLSSSKMYLPVLHLRRPMCQDNFKSTLLFIAICSYFFADIFWSIQTFQTVGILFQIEQYKYNLPICRKKDSGYVLYFVEVVFSNKFLNKGRNTNMPKDVNWLDDAQNKKSKWNEISWSIDLICFLQFTKLNIQYLACPFIYTVYIGKGLVYL